MAAEHDQWVTTVLGFAMPGPGESDVPAEGSSAPDGASPRVVWRTAKEAVDVRLEQLGAAMRVYDDPDLNRIAEFGLFGVTRGESVALNKALIEFEAAAPDRRPAMGGKLRQAVDSFRSVLMSNPVVTQIDRNPFGVSPAMRATLGAALDRIANELP